MYHAVLFSELSTAVVISASVLEPAGAHHTQTANCYLWHQKLFISRPGASPLYGPTYTTFVEMKVEQLKCQKFWIPMSL